MQSRWGERQPMALDGQLGQKVGALISIQFPAGFLIWDHVFTSPNLSIQPVNARTRTRMGPLEHLMEYAENCRGLSHCVVLHALLPPCVIEGLFPSPKDGGRCQ